MKLKQILLLFFLFNQIINQDEASSNSRKVINSCGNDFKTKNDMPTKKEDCKDDNEIYCKFVTITKEGDTTSFCAIIHGDYNDEGVLKEVGETINATVKVDGSNHLTGKNIIYYIFLYLLLFLF